MLKQFEDIFNELQYASPVKSRQLLRELEASPEKLIQFCRQARKISPVRATALVHVLAGISNPEYLLLMKDYAVSEDEKLRDAAFVALAKGENSAHKEVMLELLKSENAEVRGKACKFLGTKFDTEVELQLQKLLGDESVMVVRAALRVLASSVQPGVIKRCERLLGHSDPEIKLLSLNILKNAGKEHFAFSKVLELLNTDNDDRVRIESCRVLAENDVQRVRDDLVRILYDQTNSDYLRLEVLNAVCRLQSKDAFGIIFNIITGRGFAGVITGEARKALGRFEPDVVLELAEPKFASGTDYERLEVVRILGMFEDKQILEYFETIRSQAGNRVVLAAIIEQLARYAAADIWEYLLECIGKGADVAAYVSVQAAARLLVPERLLEFARLLDNRPAVMIAEVVLKRLVYYGQDRGLPVELTASIRPYLNGEEEPVSLFAIDAAGYVAEGALVPQIFELVGEYKQPQILDQITASIMRGVKGSLSRLLEISKDIQLQRISAIISRIERRDISERMDEFFSYLAVKAEKNVPGARLCLTVAATRFHRDYIEALDYVGDKELAYMLYAWSLLSRGIRESSFYDWGKALSNPRIAVRVSALRAMTEKDIEKYIVEIADMAFCDYKSEVREEATRVLRGIFNTPVQTGFEGGEEE